jgi:hypothetical protein
MNPMPMNFVTSFIRTAVRHVTEGAFPPNNRQDEWAIYQQDLETTRLAHRDSSVLVRAQVSQRHCAVEMVIAPQTKF